MDGTRAVQGLDLSLAALSRLMPMFLLLDGSGRIAAVGPTLAKLCPDRPLEGAVFSEVFVMRRPASAAGLDDLQARAGDQLHLALREDPAVTLRGLAVPVIGAGMLLNLSFGINVAEAVRRHSLTVADFAATDLAVEMLYLGEAKSAVMDELRSLNLRLQGAKRAAEEQALTDTLTGLRNRRALDLVLMGLIGQGQGFGLMHLDLDYFKQVNDTLGHAAGDQVLRAVAVALTEETRSSDTVARVGGDEFVLVLPGLLDPATLQRIGARIIARLGEPVMFEGNACRISGSIGVTLSSLYAAPDPERMLNDADTALYASKRGGRSQVQLYRPGIGEEGESGSP